MRFNLSLLFGTIGVLTSKGKDPDNIGELQAAYMELQSAFDEIADLKLEIVHLKAELDKCTEGLQFLQEASERRGQGTEAPAALLTLPAMWELTFGSCVLLEDGCLTTVNFPDDHDGGSCVVAINPEWTGFLFADYMSLFYDDFFTVDRQDVEVNIFWRQAPPHGMTPRHTVVWSPGQSSYGAWKLCQVNALPPWTVKTGGCYINREGCFETQYFIQQGFYHDWECVPMFEYCVVEISADWQGTLDVVDASFPQFESDFFHGDQRPSVLTVNGQAHSLSSSEDLALTGVQGMVARGTFSWTQSYCHALKMCPHAHTTLPGPWGDDPWTCTVLGDPCTLPFDFNGLSFNACTQQLSDSYDVDQDGSLHNGHPQCQSATGLSLCGPCSCAAGEEQSYNMSSVYPHTQTVGLVTCAPCAVGRFQSLRGSGTSDSCEMCPLGASSLSGATACTNCLPGMFNDYDSLECASCQPGFFGFSMGLTMCQECAVGSYTATEQQTACDGCLDGSVLIAKNVGCQQCLPGAFLSQSMTACSPCDAGRFQNASGQSECYQCSAALHTEGPNSGLWTTMSRIENVGWRETSGSRSVRDCGCAEGAWVDALGQCRECGEGITCKGMGEVEVLPGYFASADNPGFVWRCHGADWARCPGGRPGTCAQQRLNTSVACEECEPDTRMTNDGPCKACSGPDVGLLFGAIVVALVLVWCVYCVVARENRAKKMDSFALVSIVCSQFVTLFQMLGVLNTLSVAWPEPFATIVEMGSLMNFKLEVLNVGCVLSTTPLHRYVANAFAFVVLTLCMVGCHFLHVMVFHFAQFRRAHFRRFTPALFGAVGTVVMAVYISVCSASVQPLQCDPHPNGRSTMHAYRQVICWHPEGDHRNMMMIGACASLVPLAFLALCTWVSVSLPKRLYEGDTVFLNTFSFLLFRFRPGAHSYVLVLLLRNFALAVVPVIPDVAFELFSSAAVVMACVLFCLSMSPWAVHQANHLDVAMHTGLLFILLLAALQTNRVDEMIVGQLLLAVFSGMMCAFLGASAWSLRLCAVRLRKPFQFFLCHHKVGGGAFCRLLKVRLLSREQVARDVFLDSDNLQDLSLLFGVVAEKTETLVVLCTREILRRPWCVGEMTTARLHSIDTILVIFPQFEHPSRTFIEDYASVEGVQSLAPFGISVEMAQQTLWWLGARPWIVLPRSISPAGVNAVVEKLVGRKRGTQEMAAVSFVKSIIESPENEVHVEREETPVSHWRSGSTVSHQVSEQADWSAPATVAVVSVVDHTNQEAVCTALLVRELLKKFFPLTGPGHVLGPDENLPRNATMLLVMSSNGCFQSPYFVRQLFQAERLGIGAIPVIVDDSFRFPSDSFFQELRALSAHILSQTDRDADDLITLIKKLFEEIGIHVRPQDSQGVLEVRAETIARRFSARRTPLASQHVSRRASSGSEAVADVFDLEVLDDAHTERVKL